MGIEKKSQMEAEEAFKLDVVRVKLVKEAPLYSELPLQNPYEAAATIGELLCEMDREVVCVVNLQSDLKPINVTFASIGALNEALVHPSDRMNSVCEMVGIRLVDHLIVGGDNKEFFSFKEKGLMDNPKISYTSDYRNFSFTNSLVAEREKGR